MNDVICPHCKKSFELTQAFKHELEEKILLEAQEQHKKDIEKVKEEIEEKAQKKAKSEIDLQLKEITKDAKETETRNEKLIADLLKSNEEKKLLERKDKERELEMQKKLLLEEDKIRLDAQKKAEEEQRLKLLEKDKQLQDALKSNENMRRQLQQGSQQSQGEVFELEFENKLKQQYPNDKIMPVGKGIKGADLIQEVWDSRGNFTGKILWELKNTKTWNDDWVNKLKADKRSINSEEAVLISEILPNSIKTAGFKDSIWVTQQLFAIPLADTLRAKLIQMYYVKKSTEGKDGKAEILYSYLSGVEFKHRVEAIIESFSNMQTEIEKEKRYFANKWARDEKNIRQVIDGTYGMHGDLKGIIGGIMPQIKGLDDLLELENGEKN